LRGFGRKKYLLKLAFFIGFIGMIGFPGFSGFISKSLLHEALVEAQHLYDSRLLWWAEILFVASSALTVVYMLKIFVTVFVEDNEDYNGQYRKYMNVRELIPPIILSMCVILMSFMPKQVLHRISESMIYLTGYGGAFEIRVYTLENIFSTATTIAIGFILFLLVLRKFFRKQSEGALVYFNPISENINLEDILYIPLGKILYRSGFFVFNVIDAAILKPVEWAAAGIKFISEIQVRKKYDNFLERVLHQLFTRKTERTAKPAVVEKPAAVEKPSSDKMIEENIGMMLKRLRYQFNSIIYGIFIFAIALVVILFIMISNQA
jgi:NADH:ubiquinone oxidoreductase subunit 5 (subunit L)/multisubunit Na+/H+ antiporter MnhA subunit